MTLTKSLLRVALATAFLLLIPLVAMQFSQEMKWDLADFVIAGVLLFGTGLTYVVVSRMGNTTSYRLGAGVAVLAGLLLIWINLAVGFLGSENNPANLLFGAVLVVASVGALVARFRPLGMSRAMFGAALTYVVVTAIALFVWKPTGAAAEPAVHLLNVLVANGVFAALWVAAGWLFRRASNTGAQYA